MLPTWRPPTGFTLLPIISLDSGFRYTAFGLCWEFPWPQEYLASSQGIPDVVVRQVERPLIRPGKAVRAQGQRWALTESGLWMRIDGLGNFLASQEQEILTDSHRPWMAVNALPILAAPLLQRGHLLLHGGAVTRGQGAHLILGESGAGKSTAVNTLTSGGQTFLTDDLIALTFQGDVPLIAPGPACLKLRQADSASIPGRQKRFLAVRQKPMDGPVPVETMTILDAQSHSCKQLQGFALAEELHRQLYRRRLTLTLRPGDAVLRDIERLVSHVHQQQPATPQQEEASHHAKLWGIRKHLR